MKKPITITGLAIVLNIALIAPSKELFENDLSEQLKNHCYFQHWSNGIWHPFSETATTRTKEMVPFFTQDEKYLWVSLCRECESIRIIDPNNRTERIIMSPQAKTKQCKHIWGPLISRDSFELIKPEDIIFVLYKRQMYILKVTSITGTNLVDQKITYDKANISLNSDIAKINLGNLKWQKVCKAKTEIPVDKKVINFTVNSFQNKTYDPAMTIKYDQYYGGVCCPDGISYEDSAHIAIVHKNDLNNNDLIDLTKFRFKTWEDGLGNLCEKEVILNANKCPPKLENEYPPTLEGGQLHLGPIRDIAIAPDENYIVSVGDDCQIVFYHLDKPLKETIDLTKDVSNLFTVAVDSLGKNVLVGGSSKNASARVLLINTSAMTYEKIEIPEEISEIMDISYCVADKDIMFVSSSDEISFYDLNNRRFTNSCKVYGHCLGSVAFSPTRHNIALISHNTVNYQLSEPSKLTIFDQSCKETLAYQFDSPNGTYLSRLAFVSDEYLIVCLLNGKMLKWKWSAQKSEWKLDKMVPIPVGNISAIETSLDGHIIWIAIDHEIYTIDTETGKLLLAANYDTREVKSDRILFPIMVIKFIPKKQMLAIGFGDGRIALIPISF